MRVLLVEDHPLVREKLASIVRSAADFTVVGEARDGPEALALTRVTAADIVLMDISLPTMNGIEAARILKQLSPHVEILFVSQYVVPQIISDALKAGGRGYIAKSDAAGELLAGIRAVAEHKMFLSSSCARLFATLVELSTESPISGST